MKLDKSKDYGTVYGHLHASYEQGGVLFDAVGEQLSADRMSSTQPATEHMLELTESSEATFLRNILAGGPVMRSNIKRESEALELVWSDVQNTAAELGVSQYKKGIQIMWQLQEDN